MLYRLPQPTLGQIFLSGQFQKAKEFLLHVAVEETMKSKQFNVMQQLVPQIQDKKLVMCMLNTAVKVLEKEHFQRFMRTAYMSGDHSFERCLKENLCHKQWEVVYKVINECNLPEKVVTTVHTQREVGSSHNVYREAP